ncbi:hypothetical protein [Roseovarius salinarum]|uniref:hypothetical protein n=1 Tax=Roseovarius salinarum TaxID=1981892 RepID=UPI000C320637|nr:hypothetical protein [Roseovarius salinarum]
MKPNFALTLSFEGIGLLHRAHRGWHLVGEAALESDDLAGALAALRDKAGALDASGLRSKLVIPVEQIRYLDIPAAGEGQDTEQAVRDALDGATPYAVDDLVYDWSTDGTRTYIAAVARETLQEAESFALDHRFNPLGFVAVPPPGAFVGEPFFGPTAHAAETCGNETIERDSAPVEIVGAAHLPEPPEVPADIPAAAASESTATPATGATGPARPEQPPTPAAEPPAASPSDRGDAPEPEPAPATAFTSIRAADDAASSKGKSGKAARKAKGKPGQKPAGSRPPVAHTPHLAGTFAQWRKGAGDETPHEATTRTRQPSGGLRKSPAAGNGGKARIAEAVRKARPAARRVVEAPQKLHRRALGSTLARQATAAPGKLHRKARERIASIGKREEPEPIAGPVGPPAGLNVERQDTRRNGGLIFAVALIAVLLAVGGWAALFLDTPLSRALRGDTAGTTETASAEVPDAGIADAQDTSPSTADPPAAGAQLPAPEEAASEDPAAPEADTGREVAALPDDTGAADPEPAPQAEEEITAPAPPDEPEPLTPDEARARYAATGIWQRAPPEMAAPQAARLEDLSIATIDGDVPKLDAVALPDPADARTDRRPVSPGIPPPPDTEYEYDDRGFVQATEEGALTPQGVRVFLGDPAAVPPPTPRRLGPGVGLISEEDLARMGEVRPRVRPAALPERAGEEAADSELRPRVRPEALAPEEITNDAEAAPAAPDPDAVEEAIREAQDEEAGFFEDTTPQAVTASLKPSARPGDLAERAARLRAEDRDRAENTRAAALAPEQPTRASVAKQATERNRINLRRINLIGVYGETADRRALVRLANGRYRKVKVGDELDGGRVAAIGAEQLRYVKRGQSVILRMPQG